MTTTKTPSVMSVREFARMQQISESTAWKLVHEGKIETYRAGNQVRVTAEAVEAFQRPAASDLETVIKRIVDRAPALTPAQKAKLTTLLADDEDDEPVRPTRRTAKRSKRSA